jgi:hypothetical protein
MARSKGQRGDGAGKAPRSRRAPQSPGVCRGYLRAGAGGRQPPLDQDQPGRRADQDHELAARGDGGQRAPRCWRGWQAEGRDQ